MGKEGEDCSRDNSALRIGVADAWCTRCLATYALCSVPNCIDYFASQYIYPLYSWPLLEYCSLSPSGLWNYWQNLFSLPSILKSNCQIEQQADGGEEFIPVEVEVRVVVSEVMNDVECLVKKSIDRVPNIRDVEWEGGGVLVAISVIRPPKHMSPEVDSWVLENLSRINFGPFSMYSPWMTPQWAMQ